MISLHVLVRTLNAATVAGHGCDVSSPKQIYMTEAMPALCEHVCVCRKFNTHVSIPFGCMCLAANSMHECPIEPHSWSSAKPERQAGWESTCISNNNRNCKSGQKNIHSGKNCFLFAAHPMEDFTAHACTHAHACTSICMAASEQSALLSHDLGFSCPLSLGGSLPFFDL